LVPDILLVDDIHHVVICNGYPASGSPCGPFPLSYQFAVDSVLNLYDSQAPGVSSGNNLITSNATITQQIANIFMTGNLTVQGTLSPGGVGFGWPKPNPTSPPYGLGGTVFVFGGNNPNGLLFQGQSTIGNGTAAGGGLQVMGNGVQADPSYGMIGAGLTGDGATFVQRAPTTATLLQLYDGTFQFFATQSLTSGNIGNNLNGLLPVAFQLLPPATFLNLGNPVQSTYRYCTDCTTTSTTNPTCAGGGPGDAAIFTGAGWRCL
jgi:hypothetical protein